MCHACWRPAALLVGFAALVGLMGCGNSQGARATVKGKVTIGDKALTAGTVTFTNKENRVGAATINADGDYTMGDAPVGDCTVAVSVPNVAGMAAMLAKKGAGKAPAGLENMKAPDGTGGTPGPALDPSKIVPIPPKYSVPETSGLTYKVVSGSQTHDIKLTP